MIPTGQNSKQKGRLSSWAVDRRTSPPKLTVPTLPRERLVAGIAVCPGGGVTLLQSPLGYGKTILAGLVHARLLSLHRKCAWLSMAVEHNNALTLRCDLTTAMRNAGIDVPSARPSVLRDANDWSVEESLLESLHVCPSTVTLFFDGLEVLTSQATATCLSRLLMQLPANTHLVATTRRPLPVDLSRLHASGHLIELGGVDLAFSDEECETLLRGLVAGPRLREVVRLLSGWPIAAQHARMTLERSSTPDDVVNLLVNGPATLGRYIDQQLFGSLSPATQEFLAAAAELRTDSAEFVDAARGRRDRYAVQAELLDLSPLIRMTADAERSFEAHPAIVARLRNLPLLDHARKDLQLRAAEWLLAHDDEPSAVEHLLAARDFAGAARALDRAGLERLLSDLGPPQLNRLMHSLPPASLRHLPRAGVVWIAKLLNEGRRKEAKAELERLKQSALEGLFDSVPGFGDDLATLETCFRAVEDDFPSVEELRDHAETVGRSGSADYTAAVWLLQCGRFELGRRAIDVTAGLVSKRGLRFDAACLAAYRGMAEFALGNLESADRAFTTAAGLDLAIASRPPSLLIDMPRAELWYEMDRTAQAEDLLRRHVPFTDRLEDLFDVFVVRHTLTARLLLLRGDLDGALMHLRRESVNAQSEGLSARRAVLVALGVELVAQSGQPISEWLSDYGSLPKAETLGDPQTLPWRLVEALTSAEARMALTDGDAARAMDISSRMQPHWDAVRLLRGSVKARILGSAAAFSLKQHELGRRWLIEALSAAYRSGLVRLLLDERGLLLSLMTQLAATSGPALPSALTAWSSQLERKLLTQEAVYKAGGVEPLSRRERDVMVGLSQGLTNKMIGVSAGMSPNTVKHHLRRIYAKLKVKRRTQAVAEARRRSLIS